MEREASRLAFRVLVRAEQHVTAARFYENVHFLVGALASGLAVAAGGTAFAGKTTVAGIAAVAAAILTGFLTVHRPEERMGSHWRAARDYSRLYEQLTLYFNLGWKQAAEDLRPAKPAGTAETEKSLPAQPIRSEPTEGPEALARFVQRAGEIEETGFPVAERLCRRADARIAGNDEWVAPAGLAFDDWRTRVLNTRPRRLRPRR